jgi:hypothetical protein
MSLLVMMHFECKIASIKLADMESNPADSVINPAVGGTLPTEIFADNDLYLASLFPFRFSWPRPLLELALTTQSAMDHQTPLLSVKICMLDHCVG